MKKVIIFDLDGTLINSGPIALSAYRKAISTHDPLAMEQPTDEDILKTFGLPDREIWATLLPQRTEEEQWNVFLTSGVFMRDGLAQNDVTLPGATTVLKELHQRGYILTTASNCGIAYLDDVINTQGFQPWMDRPLCLESVNGVKKADILRAHVNRYAGGELVLVGDRSTDRDAAAEVNIPFIACHFGFGEPHELEGAFASIHELTELLTLFPDIHND